MSPPLSKGGNPKFEIFKKGGSLKKNFGVGETKGGKRFSKTKGRTQLFKLNLGIVKNKNEDFERQISINFFKNLAVVAKITTFSDIYCDYNA